MHDDEEYNQVNKQKEYSTKLATDVMKTDA